MAHCALSPESYDFLCVGAPNLHLQHNVPSAFTSSEESLRAEETACYPGGGCGVTGPLPQQVLV